MREFTRRSLAYSFMKLCEEKPLKDVRVKDFIRYAGISKQTFYSYFRDKSDIMNCMFELAADQILDSMGAGVDRMYYSAEAMARECLANRKFYVQMARYETQNDFLQCLAGRSEKFCRDAIRKNTGEKPWTAGWSR